MFKIYNNTVLRSYVFIIFILALASQTAGPNWLKFFKGTHGNALVIGLKISNLFFLQNS